MEAFEVYIAFVSWGKDGKRRPVLYLRESEDIAIVYRVTSRYTSKSDAIKARYFAIRDWQSAGLNKPSYIDVGAMVKIPLKKLKSRKRVGMLSRRDKLGLIVFLLRVRGALHK